MNYSTTIRWEFPVTFDQVKENRAGIGMTILLSLDQRADFGRKLIDPIAVF